MLPFSHIGPEQYLAYLTYRQDIDGLRAVAIASIVLFHLNVKLFKGGFVGVDIFFVISGFLISSLIIKEIETTGSFDFKAFYMRRIRRLFPALFFTLFVTAVVASMIFSPMFLSRFGGALSASLLNVSNIYFWQESDYFDVSSRFKPLLHTWSLSVEEQFYLLWPALLYLLYRLSRPKALFYILLAVTVVSLMLSDDFFAFLNFYAPTAYDEILHSRSMVFFLLPFRIFEFGIGALMVWIVRKKLHSTVFYDLFFVAGLAAIGYAVTCFDSTMPFPSFYALYPTLGTALLIFSGHRSTLAFLLTNPVAVGLGLISYSLYLIHWPLIVFWEYVAGPLTIFERIFIIGIAILLATASYAYIEQPFRRRRFRLTNARWKYGTVLAFFLLASAGFLMKIYDGWEWRIRSHVVFEHMSDMKDFHIRFFGGHGYSGAVHTDRPADIVLMGDSHGHQYAEGLYKLFARPNHLSFYTSAGVSCFHLPGFTRTNTGPSTDVLCPKALERGLSYIREGNEPIVILSQLWTVQTASADKLDAIGNRKHVHVTEDTVIQGILALKERIGNSPLVVIGQVPGTVGNLPDLLSRPRIPYFSDQNLSEYITTPVDPSSVAFNRRLREAATETGKFIFLDPDEILCRKGICTNLDAQNHLIYSDEDHLSIYGSQYVIQGFLPILMHLYSAKIRHARQ